MMARCARVALPLAVGFVLGWSALMAWLFGAEIVITRYVECLTR